MKTTEDRLCQDMHIEVYNRVVGRIEWCEFDHAEITLFDHLAFINTLALHVLLAVRSDA